jgi:hypothetical protein
MEMTGGPVPGRSIPPADFLEYRKLFCKVDSSTIRDSNLRPSLYRFLIYFFSATIGLNIVFAIMLISPSVPVLYRPILSIPNLALENAMACRVYRAVKLGLIKNFSGTQFEISTLSSGTRDNTGNEFTLKNRNLNGPTNLQVNVDIATTTDSNIHVSGKAFLGEGSSDADGMV